MSCSIFIVQPDYIKREQLFLTVCVYIYIYDELAIYCAVDYTLKITLIRKNYGQDLLSRSMGHFAPALL